MGAKGSSTAVIAVQIDNQGPVYGGCELSGKVYLSVPSKGYSADTLNLKFYGQESTCVNYTETESSTDSDGNSTSRSVTRTAYETCPIITIDQPLSNFRGGKIEKGNYEFPFRFTLPYGLPGKQGFKGVGPYFAIEYFVEARLHRPGWMKWDVANHQEVFLMDPPQSTVKTPSFNEPVTKPVYFCCCINKGNMSLLSNVDDTCIGVGEPLKVDYSVFNQSSASILALEVRLEQSIRWCAQGHWDHMTTILYNNRIDASNLRGIDRIENENQRRILSGLELFNEMNSHLSHVQFNVPVARSTVSGRLGNVRHTVTVRIVTKTCVQNPQIELAMTVYQPSPASFQGIAPAVGVVFARPVDWEAESAPMVTIHPSLAMATAAAASSAANSPPMATVVSVDSNPVASAPSAPFSPPSAPPAPSASTSSSYSSVSSLVQTLQTQGNAMTEVSLLKEWLTYGDVSDLVTHPGALGSIFATIRGEYALTAFPEEIGKALPRGQLTLSHVVDAARMTKTQEARAKVCTAFESFVSEKTNARVAFEVLKMPEHMLTLVLIKYGQS